MSPGNGTVRCLTCRLAGLFNGGLSRTDGGLGRFASRSSGLLRTGLGGGQCPLCGFVQRLLRLLRRLIGLCQSLLGHLGSLCLRFGCRSLCTVQGLLGRITRLLLRRIDGVHGLADGAFHDLLYLFARGIDCVLGQIDGSACLVTNGLLGFLQGRFGCVHGFASGIGDQRLRVIQCVHRVIHGCSRLIDQHICLVQKSVGLLQQGACNPLQCSGGIRQRGIGLGCAAGCVTHIAWATLGVAAVVRTSPGLFLGLKLAGAAWLLWLGIQALRSGGTLAPASGMPKHPWQRDLARGFVANALNPKVALFFLAFLPQFSDPAQGSLTLQMLALGLVFIAQTIVIFGSLALAAGSIGGLLSRHPQLGPWIDRLCGLLFVGLALRLAADD